MLLGFPTERGGHLLELVQRRIDADQGEKLRLDNLDVQPPHVGQDAPHPARRVVPSLPRGAGPVSAAKHSDEDGRQQWTT